MHFKIPRWPRCGKCGRYLHRETTTYFGGRVRRWACSFCDGPTSDRLRLPS